MSTQGAAKFANQPIGVNALVIDGVRFQEPIAVTKTPTSAGANLFEMADRSRIVQIPLVSSSESTNPQFYEFEWVQEAGTEEEWFLVDGLRASAQTAQFVPYLIETEVWSLPGGASTRALARPLASAKYPAFEATLFVTRAFVNEVEQTVVNTSPPAANEITVGSTSAGTDVETPVLTAGAVLEIRYYPAYPVLFLNASETVLDFNVIRRSVSFVEVNKQAPA